MQLSRPQIKQHFNCSTATAFDFMLHAQVLVAEASTSSGVLSLKGRMSCKAVELRTWAFLRWLHDVHEDSSQSLQCSPPVGGYAKRRLVGEACQASCSC